MKCEHGMPEGLCVLPECKHWDGEENPVPAYRESAKFRARRAAFEREPLVWLFETVQGASGCESRALEERQSGNGVKFGCDGE